MQAISKGRKDVHQALAWPTAKSGPPPTHSLEVRLLCELLLLSQ
jgi:hypothetical protein